MEIWLVIFGFLAGIIGGMGMGGGLVLVPLLVIFLGAEQTVSQGINLICFFFLATSSLILHFKNKLVDTRYLLVIILCSSVFAVGGSFLANVIPSGVLKICFGVFLIFLSFFQFFEFFNKKSNQ